MGVKELKKLLEETNDKFGVLADKEVISQYDLNDVELIRLFRDFLTDEEKMQMLEVEYIKVLSDDIKEQIIECIEDENVKLKVIENSRDIATLTNIKISNMVIDMSAKAKMKVLLGDRYNLDWFQLSKIASTLELEDLFSFWEHNRTALYEKGIRPYTIVRTMDKKLQMKFVARMEESDLSVGEKRQVFAVLDRKVKKSLEKTKLPTEYITALQMKISQNTNDMDSVGKIKADFNMDMENYRDLDELIFLSPQSIPKKNKQKILELCSICPKVSIRDSLGNISTADEYRRAEAWIDTVLQEIDAKWTDIQKVAFIDNAIGKNISYSLDVDTELFDEEGASTLWKTIHSGYGICAGIAQVEQYILSKVGIKSKVVLNDRHAFLKLEEIALPTASGEIVVGDTILDPTWNLASHRYGMMPKNFCKNYQEIRKADVKRDGEDTESHKNDEELSGELLNLDEESLKKIFSSIGIADRQGNFLGKYLFEKTATVHKLGLTEDEKIKRKLAIFEEYCPEFAACQEETITILGGVVSAQREAMEFNECIIDRVYMRDDKEKKPVMYMYMNFSDIGEKFYFVDGQEGCFGELSREEFESKFECYDRDLEKSGGDRPWERDGDIKDLNPKTRRVIIRGEEVR